MPTGLYGGARKHGTLHPISPHCRPPATYNRPLPFAVQSSLIRNSPQYSLREEVQALPPPTYLPEEQILPANKQISPSAKELKIQSPYRPYSPMQSVRDESQATLLPETALSRLLLPPCPS